MNIEKLKQKYKELGEEIEKAENDNKGLSVLGWISENFYKCVQIGGGIGTHEWQNDYVDNGHKEFLGVFKNEADAKTRLALVKALCPNEVWIPEENERYWSWTGNHIDDLVWANDYHDIYYLTQGNVHRTEEAAKVYEATLKAWSDLLTE